MRKTFKYRLYPTDEQERVLDRWLWLCRRLYNAMLEQRQIAYKMGYRVKYLDQQNELPALRKEMPEYDGLPSTVLQDVARRLDKTFQSFFKGAGYPKFQGRDRYDSFTYGAFVGKNKVVNDWLFLSHLGSPIRMVLHRALEGRIKTATIKRRAGQWYVCFSCDDVPEPTYLPSDTSVGVDLGIEALATTSEGERFDNVHYLKRRLKHLRRVQRHLARQKKGSNRRKKTVRQLQRLHLKIANQRADANHTATTSLVKRYGTIVVEDISPQFMLANRRLAQAASDVGWGQFMTFLQSKAAQAGRKLVKVNPAYTSQTCSGCGVIVPKKLSERWHDCPECGTNLHRDHNAAINILKAANQRGPDWAVGDDHGHEVE